jgi:t-SNARE complex subunit (syntaxin)
MDPQRERFNWEDSIIVIIIIIIIIIIMLLILLSHMSGFSTA